MGNKDCGLFNEFGRLPLFLACVRKAAVLMARLPKAGRESRMEKPCLPGKDSEWAMRRGDGLPRKAVRQYPLSLFPLFARLKSSSSIKTSAGSCMTTICSLYGRFGMLAALGAVSYMRMPSLKFNEMISDLSS